VKYAAAPEAVGRCSSAMLLGRHGDYNITVFSVVGHLLTASIEIMKYLSY
jgi:hypothetical protein